MSIPKLTVQCCLLDSVLYRPLLLDLGYCSHCHCHCYCSCHCGPSTHALVLSIAGGQPSCCPPIKMGYCTALPWLEIATSHRTATPTTNNILTTLLFRVANTGG